MCQSGARDSKLQVTEAVTLGYQPHQIFYIASRCLMRTFEAIVTTFAETTRTAKLVIPLFLLAAVYMSILWT